MSWSIALIPHLEQVTDARVEVPPRAFSSTHSPFQTCSQGPSGHSHRHVEELEPRQTWIETSLLGLLVVTAFLQHLPSPASGPAGVAAPLLVFAAGRIASRFPGRKALADGISDPLKVLEPHERVAVAENSDLAGGCESPVTVSGLSDDLHLALEALERLLCPPSLGHGEHQSDTALVGVLRERRSAVRA